MSAKIPRDESAAPASEFQRTGRRPIPAFCSGKNSEFPWDGGPPTSRTGSALPAAGWIAFWTAENRSPPNSPNVSPV